MLFAQERIYLTKPNSHR